MKLFGDGLIDNRRLFIDQAVETFGRCDAFLDAAGAVVCDVPVNRGQGAALRLGYRLAREGGAQYIVTTDADGQYNPAEIPALMAPILARVRRAARRPRIRCASSASGSSP